MRRGIRECDTSSVAVLEGWHTADPYDKAPVMRTLLQVTMNL